MASILEDSAPPVSVPQAATVLKDHYGLAGNIQPLTGDRDRNFVVRSDVGLWMLKIANPAERSEVLLTQQEVLHHCLKWDSSLVVPAPVPTKRGLLVATANLSGVLVPIRLTTFLPGITVEESGWNQQLRLDAAATLGRLDLALRSFTPTASGAPQEWQVDRLGELRNHAAHLADDRRTAALRWLDYFEESVVGRLGALRTQAIHGDFNPANLIVDPDDRERIAGVIDFGDLTVGPLAADPAIAAAYQCLHDIDPGRRIAEAAVDYHRLAHLTDDEIELFAPLAISRLVQSLIISGWRAALHPENRQYILIHAEPIWAALQRLDIDRPHRVVARVEAACGSPVTKPRATGEALAARRLRLSPGMRLSYDHPLRIQSGSGVWLSDSDGVRYLDAYNNVAHIGHGHPAVVEATAAQARRLNTNTRYLVDEVTDYADRLTALLPAPLEVVFFTNSGSEANDLAWRIARTVTARKGMVVTSHAYHGSTELTISTSPEELGIENLPSWVATTPAPSQTEFSSDGVRNAVLQLRVQGNDIAAFACDTVFSSDGIYDPPAAYLETVYDEVRRCGGLCIADEVQAGFGRVGTRFWGFAGSSVVPDIVTIGKPMGNGHPIAAVITSSEIAREFSKTGYFFSTFAGSPVAAAAGGAVLDVMEREGLPEQAERVGEYVRRELVGFLATHHINADVRGPGMFIGLEVRDGRGRPDADKAHLVQNRMRENRVLIGRTGINNNVLKIRPPLVFTETHADILLETLDGVVSALNR